MAKRNANRISLSKSILEMKFMKRTKEKVDKQIYQQEGEEYFGRQSLAKHSGRYIVEASYSFCEELIDGRMSFQGENPEIERLMELEALEKRKNVKYEDEADISDVQMAKLWHSTKKINVTNISKTELKSLDDEPKRKKPKFLKPADD